MADQHLSAGRGELTPRHLRIYANHAAIIDFEDAEVTKPQLDVTLQEGEVGVIEYPLNTPAFANVHALSVFFVSTITKLVERQSYVFVSERSCRRRSDAIVLYRLQGGHQDT